MEKSEKTPKIGGKQTEKDKKIVEKTINDFTYEDIEGLGRIRYKKGFHYLIRPDSYIIGTFEDVDEKVILSYVAEQIVSNAN